MRTSARKSTNRGFCLSGAVAALAGLIFLIGCGAAPKTPPAAAPVGEPKKKDMPKLPDEAQELGSAMETIVQHAAPAAAAVESYTQDETIPSGTVVGVLRFQSPASLAAWPNKAIDVEQGPQAVQNPMPGETAYYKNAKLKTPVYSTDRTPRGALVRVRDVKVGRHPPLGRALFNVSGGNCDSMIFFPPNERLYFGTWDSYPCEIELKRQSDGKVVFTGKMQYGHDLGKDPLVAGTRIPTPEAIQTETIAETGFYRVACKRHPWQQACVYVADNPYIACANGGFTFSGLPVGHYTLEVWHPVLEPVNKTIEFDIRKDEKTEIKIEFKTSEELKEGAKK